MQHKADLIEQPAVQAAIAALAALLVFYIGGWYVAWGTNIWPRHGAVYLNWNVGAVIRVNGLYYGMLFEPRWFDAPFVSFALFWIGVGLMYWCVSTALELLTEEAPSAKG